VEKALQTAGATLDALDLIAVTVGPGLVGSLLVGLETAKMLAYITHLPLVGVNHIEGHLLSPFVDEACRSRLDVPYVALVVSGGHTSLFHVTEVGDYTCLGQTLDDAAGEAFDKVAKRLGHPYPGGPLIDRMAERGDPRRFRLPRPMLGRGLDFSFSGLKTAVSTRVDVLEKRPREEWEADLGASVQAAIVDVLVAKCRKALARTGVERLVVCGGVACNRGLRSAVRELGEALGVEVLIPAPSLCTDNGAMIAAAGAMRFERHMGSDLDGFELDVDASLPL
jgi:N6-L-threonylcarbamoyladenine synthase